MTSRQRLRHGEHACSSVTWNYTIAIINQRSPVAVLLPSRQPTKGWELPTTMELDEARICAEFDRRSEDGTVVFNKNYRTLTSWDNGFQVSSASACV